MTARSSDTDPGACGDCRHARRIRSPKGSLFFYCRRAETDSSYPRYPRLPVAGCAGHEPGAPTEPVRGSAGFWRRYWFLGALAVVVAAGIAAPGGGRAIRGAGFVLPLLTASALFLSGLSLETSNLRLSRANASGLALGLGATYVAAPALAWALAHALGPPVTGAGSEGYLFLEATMIAASQASTIASAPALTMIAGGNQGLALLLTVTSNAATVVLTPLVLRLSLGAIVAFPIGTMMTRMILVVLLPIAAGQIARRLVWRRLAGALPAIRITSQSIILVFVYTGVSSAAEQLGARPDVVVRLFLVAALLHLLLVALVWLASDWIGLSPPSRAAVVFCGTQKTLPNGIYLWDRFFPANPHGALALVGYHVFQLVVDTLLVSRLARQAEAARS